AAAAAPVLFGGGSGSAVLGDTWAWNGYNWTALGSSGAPSAREWLSLAPDPSGGLMMFGGQGSTGTQSDTWTWLGTVTQGVPAPTINSCPGAPGPSASTYSLP